jgi:quercetin dioxygenase-like cupin family protein
MGPYHSSRIDATLPTRQRTQGEKLVDILISFSYRSPQESKALPCGVSAAHSQRPYCRDGSCRVIGINYKSRGYPDQKPNGLAKGPAKTRRGAHTKGQENKTEASFPNTGISISEIHLLRKGTMMFVRRVSDVPNVDWLEGVKKRLLIGPRDGAPTFLMRIYEIAPGTTYPLHSHNYEHEGMPLSGEGTLVGKDLELKIEPGVVYFIPPNEPHAVINKGKDMLRLLCTAPLCAYNAMMDPETE